MSEDWRPQFCPDPKGCAPVFRPLTDSDNPNLDNPGFAVHCYGALAAPIVWVFNDVKHVEDLSNCSYSPLKGVIRWLENIEDWSVLGRTYRAAVEAVKALRAEREAQGERD